MSTGQTRPVPAGPMRPLQEFVQKESSSGLVLVAMAVVALVWANSPWRESYFDLWSHVITIGFDDHAISLTVVEWINDGLMTIFFLVAGLEIKRELTVGGLRDPREAALPILGALGGMIAPALIYTALNAGGPGADGWGIPMATDIAIVLGAVSLLGTRAPGWLKVFLLALAIADDMGAIIVIAVFYSDGVSFEWLAFAIGMLAIAAIIRTKVPYVRVYVLLGALCWFGLHEANIHPTLAGVAFGLLAPMTPIWSGDPRTIVLPDDPTPADTARAARRFRDSMPTTQWLIHKLLPWSAFGIVPLFALANAGVYVPADEVGDALSSEVTWGVILGLVVGKPLGITVAVAIAVITGLGRLPKGVTWRYVIGAGALAGVGFTVALFVTELAFGESVEGRDARLGVLIASLVAAVIGAAICIPGRVTDDEAELPDESVEPLPV
jgi:Na+:H+ antiporter, NhaA family